MGRHAGYYARAWILLAALNNSSRANDQSQMLGPWSRVLAHGLTRWLMTGKEVGARIGPEGGKVSGEKWGRWMDGFWSWRLGAAEGDARESRWWGAQAAGDRCARPDQRFCPSPLEH